MKSINFSELGDLVLNAKCLFSYGSRVYGTYSKDSDFDYIYIFDDEKAEKLDDQYIYEGKNTVENYSIYGITKFQQMMNDHHITALECYFLPQEHFISYHQFDFKLNLQQLRKSISEKTSHSWVKAKKKFEIEDDRNIYVGKKSLFHSMRIIDFGTQIAKTNKIENYQSCVHLWNEIKNNPSENWKDYETKYKSIFNQMMSEFRKLAPK